MSTTTHDYQTSSPAPVLDGGTDWAALFHHAPIAMCVASLVDGRLLAVNERYEQMAGAPRDGLIGRLASELHVVESDAARERIAIALDEHAVVFDIASRLRAPDGTMRATLSSLRIVELNGEPAMLSVTVDSEERAKQEAAALDEAKALKEQLARMEREIARHSEREHRLIDQISGLCDQAGLLKNDVMRLKSLQQDLTTEIEGLRKHGDHRKGEGTVPAPSIAPAAEVRKGATTQSETPADEPFASVIGARLAEVEEELLAHVSALRAQAARLEAEAD